VESKPAIDESGSTIYVEAESRRLFAVNIANGFEKWRFDLMSFVDDDDIFDSSPIIGADGTIYVGSKDGRLFAVNPEDGSERWRFPVETELPIGEVRSSPAIGPDGTIYFGSDDNNLYAVTPFAVPRNFRDETFEDNKLIISDDFDSVTFSNSNEWLKEGPWAVRMEITRQTVSIDGEDKGRYLLKTWVEKCDGDCSAFIDGLFRDTRVVYNVAGRPHKLVQTITISQADNEKFERFLFGFTTAAKAGDSQQAIIRDFELTFSRPGDPVVYSD
jgi:hypothetical protein